MIDCPLGYKYIYSTYDVTPFCYLYLSYPDGPHPRDACALDGAVPGFIPDDQHFNPPENTIVQSILDGMGNDSYYIDMFESNSVKHSLLLPLTTIMVI